jgi:hypothetical protein
MYKSKFVKIMVPGGREVRPQIGENVLTYVLCSKNTSLFSRTTESDKHKFTWKLPDIVQNQF